MSKPLRLEIGRNVPQEEPPAPAAAPTVAIPAPESPAAEESQAAPSNESLAEVYEAIKRHEETLRDLIVEIRLLYHNLSDKEKQKLEARRDWTARELRDNFAGPVRALEEKIARLRGK